MIRLRRWLPAIAATLLLAGGSAALTAGPAHATNRPQPHTAKAHKTSGTQICNVQDTDVCLNARRGEHTPGDYVILYTNGDPNNTFQAGLLTGICGGYVKGYSDGACPFANGSGLNDRYDGDAIVQFYDYTSVVDYDPPLCVADSGVGSGSAALGTCSWAQTNYGWGGSTGEVFILSGIKNFLDMGITPFWAVNFHYTSIGVCGVNKPAWMVGATKGVAAYLNSCSASNQWFQAP